VPARESPIASSPRGDSFVGGGSSSPLTRTATTVTAFRNAFDTDIIIENAVAFALAGLLARNPAPCLNARAAKL